jgi:hypothetical protein
MKVRLSLRTTLGSLVAGALSVVLLPLTGGQAAAAPAPRAVDPQTVITAVKFAYEAYNKLNGGGLTLEQATQQILDAINGAKTEIITHIDQIAVTQVRSCARSAVIDLADIRAMSQDTLQAFARDATSCATLAEAQVSELQAKSAVDQLGFAVNTVGPIALLARTKAGFSTALLRSTLINANSGIIAKLTTSCHATPLWGDAPPGGNVEVILSCTVYAGHTGTDWIVVPGLRRDRPLPPFDYTIPAAKAQRTTSFPLAQTALATL